MTRTDPERPVEEDAVAPPPAPATSAAPLVFAPCDEAPEADADDRPAPDAAAEDSEEARGYGLFDPAPTEAPETAASAPDVETASGAPATEGAPPAAEAEAPPAEDDRDDAPESGADAPVSGAPRRIDLPAALGPAEAEWLADAIRAARGAPLELEAHAVKRIGGQCVQILLAARAAWAADGASFGLVEPSPEVSESLRLLGLRDRALTGDAA